MAQVAIEALTKRFGEVVVADEISATVEDGEFVVILGPSGCGKSTILRMIAGLEPPDSGAISIGGRRVDGLAPKDRGCAMVFQNYALYPHMSVRGNLAYGLKVAGLDRAAREARIEEAAALLELTELLDRKPKQLSGGQRQRVAIGRAIVREPQVFLFDEPLSNLDAKLRGAMRAELRKLHDRIGGTSILVTHDQIEAMTLADRMIVLNQGRIEQIGAPSEVYRRPSSVFVADFLGTPPMNLLRGAVRRDPLRFASSGGAEIALPERFAGLTPDQPVVLGLRPEDLTPGGAGLDLTVGHVENLGAHRLVHCALGGEAILVIDHARMETKQGERISVGVAPDAVALFCGETGRALA